jgi:hypothetical protein
MMRDLMRRAELYPPIFVPVSLAERDSLQLTLRNEVRASDWDQVSGLLDTQPTITNTRVRVMLRTDDTLRVSKLLRGWVDLGLLEVANPDGAKQNRQYRKPGTPPDADLFSNIPGNETARS